MDIYQEPVVDRLQQANVFWVGLSAVLFDEADEKLPLSILTPSGSLVHSIEKPYRKFCTFYKTNLVKCAPVADDKIRYPSGAEMEQCFPNFLWELEALAPRTIFLLGKQVSDFVTRKLKLPTVKMSDSFDYETVQYGEIQFVPIHHPSYILVYKRKLVQEYTEGLQSIITRSIAPKKMKKRNGCLQD